MSIAIKVDNLSKQYRLGKVGTGALSHDLNRWWHRLQGKEDPYLKIGESNDRSRKGSSEYVWVLRDINFEIQQGDAVGIIGRNGAGKSTLLKILSRTTGPTTGNVRMKGRVASLLEVGTGFHPELTGRENIFLNGAILGMNRFEIQSKFDEIVDFSGVERYIDTPVKRYSSGMYVRLAFAVAAHLESEILIIDEVLAVGDAEFQKKCLGKMGEVSQGEGRTILFVSHNMQAIRTLCPEGIVLRNGTIVYKGSVSDCINSYGQSGAEILTKQKYIVEFERPATDNVELISYRLLNDHLDEIEYFNIYDEVNIEVEYLIKNNRHLLYPNLHFFNSEDHYLFVNSAETMAIPRSIGLHKMRVKLAPYLFNVGLLKIGIAFTLYPGTDVQFFINPAIIVEVREERFDHRGHPYTGPMPGVTRFNLDWTFQSQ
jgi:lipopolysaccharide transport system ATP-binding protein